MSLGRDEVLHVATLAELAVPDDQVDELVSQFNRILAYVAQLEEASADETAPRFLAGPSALALQDDVERPAALTHPPAEIAPEFRDGFFLVPRHGAMEDL